METSVSPLFMKIENNKHPQKKKHTPSPVGAVLEDEDEEEEELLKLYDQEKKQSHNKNKKKMLRRRSSLSAEIEGSFDSSKGYQNNFDNTHPSDKFMTRKDFKMLTPHQNVHSSMSLLSMATNNAITVVPSRNSRMEPNVFDTRNHKRHRRRRSTTPEPVNSRNGTESSLQSVLSKIDHRIKNKFGDWTNMDDDVNFEYRNFGRHRDNRRGASEGPSSNGISTHTDIPNGSVSLPPLFKGYHAVLKSSKGKLLDKSQRIALSKDNNDPNSILSEAKRTLTQMGRTGRSSE
ncbi:unnamed protein product [Allacma fusca]|uniref:Uncharacterized protein n=1 Tax=Allacma fusca TaxID=39272 RepID=A0A8J2NP31_9HEXA|nr:unnamed protein product [Allacma fusca]